MMSTIGGPSQEVVWLVCEPTPLQKKLLNPLAWVRRKPSQGHIPGQILIC